MSFWSPLLIGAAIGSVVTWQLERRRQHCWVRSISTRSVPTPVTPEPSETPPGNVGTPQDAVSTTGDGSSPVPPTLATSTSEPSPKSSEPAPMLNNAPEA